MTVQAEDTQARSAPSAGDSPELTAEVSELRARLEAAEIDRDKSRQQLSRWGPTLWRPVSSVALAICSRGHVLPSVMLGGDFQPHPAQCFGQVSPCTSAEQLLLCRLTLSCRLKQQMVTEQEDEEEKIRWRVDAELQSALRLAASEQEAAGSAVVSLKGKLQDAEARIQGLQTDLSAWETAVSERDAELQNLQV